MTLLEVKNLKKTSEDSPAQWEGETDKGIFYARYRHGDFWAGVRDKEHFLIPIETFISGQLGREWDGHMTDEVFNFLLRPYIEVKNGTTKRGN